MPYVTPVDLEASEEAKKDIEWLASATGFVANSMLTLSHRPEIAKAALELTRAVVRNPDGTVDPALRVAMTGRQCQSYATPEDMRELRQHFSEEQIIEIGSVIALFGFNNRWNALMETETEDSVVSFTKANKYKRPGTTNLGQT